MLLGQGAVTGYVGRRVWTHKERDPINLSGLLAYVLMRDGGWGVPQPRRHDEYPVLLVQCWADRSRDEAGEPTKEDEEERAWSLYRVLDPLLHGVRDVVWGGQNGLTVVSSDRTVEPFFTRPPSSDAGFVAVRYGIVCHH